MKYFDKSIKPDRIIDSRKEKSFDKINHYEKKLIKLRKKVNEMFFNHHLSKSMIAKKKKVSRNFVIEWTKAPTQDFTKDPRGWPKGKRRKWSKTTENRIKEIYQDLENNPSEFYSGATAIADEWRRRNPKIPSPPLISIGRILKDLGLSKKRSKGKHKGAAKYLCYPEYTIFNIIAKRVLEIDFIGKKFITARTEPLNFIAFSFKKEPRLRYFKRILAENGDEIIKYSKLFFERFERPEAVKMDNGFAMAGSSSHPRVISKAALWFLSQEVIPIYSVPRRPFSQASIEGNNSVFARKFWNRIDFQAIEEVDEKLEWFNRSSERYCHYQRPNPKESPKGEFIPKIYFIRQVKEQDSKAFIEVTNERVFLPTSYINYFVLAEWNLKEETLYIHFEKEQKPEMIKKLSFKINPRSKEKLQKIPVCVSAQAGLKPSCSFSFDI